MLRKKYTKSEIILFLLVAFVVSFLFGKDNIRKIVSVYFMPEETIELITLEERNEESLGNEVWITGVSGITDIPLEQIDSYVVEKDGFEFRRASEYGYSSDVILNNAQAGSYIKMKVKVGEINEIVFWKQNFSGNVLIKTPQYEKIIDLYSNIAQDLFAVQIHASSEHIYIRYYSVELMLSVLLYCFSFLLVVLIYRFRKKIAIFFRRAACMYWHSRYRRVYSVILLVLYLLLLVYLYFNERV